MSRNTLDSQLDELANLTVMADGNDPESIKELTKKIIQLVQSKDIVNHPNVLKKLKLCQEYLDRIEKGSSNDTDADLQEVSKAITELQSSQQNETSMTNGDDFILPEHVDESIFHEFISKQKSVLEEWEGDVLALEKGDSDRLASLKRRIHTLKGESGVLGMNGLMEVCHSLEDIIIATIPLDEKIDRLLQVRDWVTLALDSYINFRMPTISAETIIEQLRSVKRQSVPLAKTVEHKPASPQTPNIPHADSGNVLKPELVKTPVKAASSETPPKNTSSTTSDATPSSAIASAQNKKTSRDEETVVLLGEFLQEGEDGLTRAEQLLMNAEQDDLDPEVVNGLFRVFHTIKGVAGFLELHEITSLSHITETMLNQVRQKNLNLQGTVLDLVFDSTDVMRRMLAEVRRAVESSEEFQHTPGVDELVALIKNAIEGKPLPQPAKPDVPVGLKIGEVLQKTASVSQDDISKALESQQESGRRLGEELVAQGAVQPKQVVAALRAQNQPQNSDKQSAKLKETVKVDLDRVDSLVEMIGELVIVESMVVNAHEIASLSSPKIRNFLGQLTKITRDLQDVGMRMRMVPVRGVFQKMARMVRDLARKNNKSVMLVQSGEATEMDRSMVEQLEDPLVHMIRNSIDHGVENREDRIKAGKPEQGIIQLSAYHQGGSIVIEIADDGHGLNREAIMRKAISQGLIKEGEPLSDNEINELIFLPGFSTAKVVTELSGRGVGMDVVRRNVEAMRGRVSISSVPCQGTTFKMLLPLTLAIIDGMLVACGDERYIIPTLSIVESIKPDTSMLSSIAQRDELINIRGEILPLFRLDRLFDVNGAQTDPTQSLVVVVETAGRKMGLVVDDVVTQQQVVIKSLGSALHHIRFVSGAAILSDGKVGLILNVDELGSLVEELRKRTSRGFTSTHYRSLSIEASV